MRSLQLSRSFGIHTLGLALGASALSIFGCAGVRTWEEASRGRFSQLQQRTDLAGIRVPILRSPSLEQAWGAPKIQRDTSGGYLLTYADPKAPFRRLQIHGLTAPLPALTQPPPISGERMVRDQLTGYTEAQAWRRLVVRDTEVRWFLQSPSSGADGAYYSTEGFSRTAPDGRLGHYRLVAENGDDAASVEEVARWFRGVAF